MSLTDFSFRSAVRRLASVTATATLLLAGPAAISAPVLDAQGRLDVWGLRRDVQAVAFLRQASLHMTCKQDPGDHEAASSPAQQARLERRQKDCEGQAGRAQRRFEAARQQLNRAWGPALLAAVKRGDAVAEVILRQCRTSLELDRSEVESTCDPDWVRQQVAHARLREIGFVPGTDPDAGRQRQDRRADTGAVQTQALQRFAAGDYSLSGLDTYLGGNGAKSPEQVEDHRREYAIQTLQARAWHAFHIDLDAAPLSRRLAMGQAFERPDEPVWGSDYNNSNTETTVPQDQTLRGREIYLDQPNKVTRRHIVAGPDDARFLQMVSDTLAASQAAIADWLRRDPRWGVFEVQRVGRFEWVSPGQPSTAGRLDAPWAGRYTLVRAFDDFLELPVQRPATAQVGPVAGDDRIEWDHDPASGGRANCMLRYSGGSSYLPTGGRHESEITHTVLGYLPNLTQRLSVHDPAPVAPFAPMDPTRRYRQVLVQCPQGEWPGQQQVRMLYLAGHTLVEVFRPAGRQATVQVRHWQRSGNGGSGPAPGPGLADMAQANQAELQALRQRSEQALAAQARWDQASTAELLSMLATSRIQQRTYARDDFPQNVKLLEGRAGIVAEVCRGYQAQPADPMVRFNLVALMAMQLKDGTAAANAPAAADCLRSALTDSHPWVRGEAAWGLSFAGRAQDALVLRALLEDTDPTVRRQAEQAIRKLPQ